jgi:hypothetical protein
MPVRRDVGPFVAQAVGIFLAAGVEVGIHAAAGLCNYFGEKSGADQLN